MKADLNAFLNLLQHRILMGTTRDDKAHSVLFKHRVDSEGFRRFIQQDLTERCKRNQKYSMRAYAKSLGVEPSVLSKLLRGERAISQSMFDRIIKKLAIPAHDVRRFFQTSAESDVQAFDQIGMDTFHVISDWYHLAILELVQVKSFRSSMTWISQALGISIFEARLAVDRLVRLQLLQISETGAIRSSGKALSTVGYPFTSSALQKMQSQILDAAKLALTTVGLERRDQSTMTMAISTDRLEEAKIRIKEFRRELCAFLEGGGDRAEVYQLSVSLFPVTHLSK